MNGVARATDEMTGDLALSVEQSESMETSGRARRKTDIARIAVICGAFVLGLAQTSASTALPQNSGAANETSRASGSYQQTTSDYNRRLSELDRAVSGQVVKPPASGEMVDYRIGSDDQLDISVLEAPELSAVRRVSESGDISLALIGTVRAAGLTTHELEIVVEELLRRNYIKDPHVSVQVRDIQSHPVAVFGAVKKPGVFQIREPKTVVEMLSMAEGLDTDAGDVVIVEHRGSRRSTDADGANENDDDFGSTRSDATEPSGGADISETQTGAAAGPSMTRASSVTPGPATEIIDLKKLLDTGDPRLNVLVNPGDVVKVPRAELVYVVGEVARPGGFELKSNERVSVLQAIALAQGLTHTSSSAHARIIRTDAITGARLEIPIDVNKILAGKVADPLLQPRDILFVPDSAGRSVLYRGVEAAVSIGSGVAVYRW
jgi:polysaccharide biosynthesis/export protein